jgi:fructokinase
MGRVFGLGETVLDVIFKEGQAVTSRPGGPAVNGLISLARVGHETYLISELGADVVGETIAAVLEENSVDTRWLYRFSSGKTPVALAFLDAQNNAWFENYRDFPDERFRVEVPDFAPGDLLLFGSSFAVNPVVRPQVRRLIRAAREKGAYILYDPNLRKHHAPKIEEYRPSIEENLELAHLVRGSDEDFQTIFPGSPPEDVLGVINGFGAEAIITTNAGGVYCSVSGAQFHVPVPEIAPVSTNAAGDNFNAGLVHGLMLRNCECRDRDCWKELVETATSFSTDVCMSLDNCISDELAAGLRSESGLRPRRRR